MFRRRPVLTAYLIAAIAWAGLAVQAMAEESTMRRPIEAATLHEGPLDMVAYFQPGPDGTLVVTATFAARGDLAEPMRVVLALATATTSPSPCRATSRRSTASPAPGTRSRVRAPARPWRAVARL